MDSKHYDSTLLRRWRVEQGLTQQEVANRLRLHRNTVARAEEGSIVSFETLSTIADFYGKRVKELIL